MELVGEAPGQVHRAEGMLKAAVLGRWKHPPGGLKLRHAPQPLHPGRVDEVLLRRFPRYPVGTRVQDVLVNGIGDEPPSLVCVDAFHRVPRKEAPPAGLANTVGCPASLFLMRRSLPYLPEVRKTR